MKQKKKIQRMVARKFDKWEQYYSCLALRKINTESCINYRELFHPKGTNSCSAWLYHTPKTERKEMRIMMLLLFAELYPSEYVNSEMI